MTNNSIWLIDRTLIRCYHSRPEWTEEQWQWKDTPHSPKLLHYRSFSIRWCNAISKALVMGGLTHQLLPTGLICVCVCVCVYVCVSVWFSLSKAIGLIGRVFANSPGDQSSIPGRVIPKTQKWHLIPPCLIHSIIR